MKQDSQDSGGELQVQLSSRYVFFDKCGDKHRIKIKSWNIKLPSCMQIILKKKWFPGILMVPYIKELDLG